MFGPAVKAVAVAVSPAETATFYDAAIVGLRALERREGRPRRFGPEVDARWAGFHGHLGTSARLDLLIRDAAITWPSAFSPAVIFQLPGLASDEPFGPDWEGLAEHVADRTWQRASGHSLDHAAEALGIEAGGVDIGPVAANRRIVVAGGRAVRAVADIFTRDDSLSWSEQVLVVAVRPNVRHFAGLAAPIIGASSATAVIAPSEQPATALRTAGFAGATPIASSDADSAARQFIDTLRAGG